MNGQYIYVVDMDGNIIIGTRGGQRMPNPTLVGGSNPSSSGWHDGNQRWKNI